jgi:pimeloyl-ACP methyl ester carboxylesterase
MMSKKTDAIIKEHEANGKYITIDGVKTFYLDVGTGPIVFCIHGVPTSSFLYRKVATSLQNRNMRTIAIDLPGLGLSARPEDFEYTFSNFGNFCNRFLDEVKIEEIHLLIHDVGTPIGLYMAHQKSSRIKSITVLNSMLDVEHFVKPLAMRPFEMPILGEAELVILTPLTFPLMMKGAGVVDMDVISHNEMAAYIHLLKRDDEGKAFLKIMRSFEKTKAFTEVCCSAWKNLAYPVQLIWGDKDPFLPFAENGKEFVDARPDITVTKVESKHFLQEEQYEMIAEKLQEISKIK